MPRKPRLTKTPKLKTGLLDANDLKLAGDPQDKKSLQELAKPYAKMALSTLAQICRRGDTDSARASAAMALLDRGYGRPAQAMQISGDPDGAPIRTEQVVKDADAFTRELFGLVAKRGEKEASKETRH